MPHRFARSRSTWLAYCVLAFYSYFLNALGPVTPFLRAELHLSYTTAGWHFTAFAIGILLAGLLGARLVARVGRWQARWIGVGGITAGCLLLVTGRHPLITVGGTLLMGAVGSFILAIVVSSLSDEHGPLLAIALTEANLLASAVSALAGVAVGLAARSPLGWRGGLVVPLLAAPLLYLANRDVAIPAPRTPSAADRGDSLPPAFWVLWCALVAVVSVEFCLIFWAAAFLSDGLGVPRERAALSVSVFLAAMLAGRLAGSRLVRRIPAMRLLPRALLLAAAGFLAYWRAPDPAIAFLGLFTCGLGVANLYPFILSLALATTTASDAAAARATLASGVAISSLPLLLAQLADAFGIRPAHALVVVLLAVAWGLVRVAARGPRARDGAA